MTDPDKGAVPAPVWPDPAPRRRAAALADWARDAAAEEPGVAVQGPVRQGIATLAAVALMLALAAALLSGGDAGGGATPPATPPAAAAALAAPPGGG